jgi:uncharacterized protein
VLKPMNSTIEPKLGKTLKQAEAELKKLLGDKLKKLILFGSYSRGDYNNESDIDLIALVDETNPEEKFAEQIVDIMVDLSLKNDSILSIFMENDKNYEEEKSVIPLLKNIEKEGMEIYAV